MMHLPANSTKNKKPLNPLFIIGALFFVFGFVTWLGSVLIPYLRIACELTTVQSYLVAFAFYISYFIMGIPSSIVLKYTGFKNGMSVGLLIMALGALLFIPAALTRMYSLFLLGLFVQGTGLTILQTASNPYVTILGPRESAAKRISIMGICNGIAGALAPIILGAIVLSDADTLSSKLEAMSGLEKTSALNALAQRVIMPYSIMVILLILMAVLTYFSSLPAIDAAEEDEATGFSNKRKTSILQFPHLIIGVITLFLYVGVEVIAADSVINYGASQGIAMSTAKFFTSFTLIGMLLGYVIGVICIPRYFSQQQALIFSAVIALVFAFAAIFTDGYVSITFVALLGLANSLMWPSLWPLAIDGLGRFTKIGSSLLIMAVGGGAVVPLLYGKLAEMYSFHQAYWLVIPCYIMIGYYAIHGHKVGKLKTNTGDVDLILSKEKMPS